MPDLRISNLSDDNRRSSFRSQEVRVAGKTVTTPGRSLEPSRLKAGVSLEETRFPFSEVYREITESQARTFNRESEALDVVSSRLRALTARAPTGAIRLCFVKYIPESPGYRPTTASLDLLADVAHSYSDLVPIPAISGRVEASNYGRFDSYVRSAYRSIERLNNKPVMGYLPTLPRAAYPRLLRFYLENDIRAFYCDFEGRMPDHLKLRPILAYLAQRGVLESSILYGLNARPGRFLRNAQAILSKDFISYGYGIDVLGGRHIRAPIPPRADGRGDAVGRAASAQAGNKRRLFLKHDYGYHQLGTFRGSGVPFPIDSAVPQSLIFEDPTGSAERLFNMEQQALESDALRTRLGALGRRESVLDYLATKRFAALEIPHLRTLPRAVLPGYD